MVIDSDVKEEIELKGVMGVLAAAASIADIDVFGTTGKNTGYIIEKDKDGKVLRARVVKIDPGFAFKYELAKKIKTPKDIFYSTHNKFIKWDNLTESQKEEFLEVKRHNLEIIKDPRILEYIFFRQGHFNRSNTEKMPKELAIKLMEQFIGYVKDQGKIYGEDLRDYEPKREKIFFAAGTFWSISNSLSNLLMKFKTFREISIMPGFTSRFQMACSHLGTLAFGT